MTNKQLNPEMDFGFFASVPRLVRTSYKTLSATQKWLYVCLKDLCGDRGTCYRALRALAEETGISTGMLSESIKALHEVGLIHAEKKRRERSPTGKEVWHITITDIWQLNGRAHPLKRSLCEQQCSHSEPPTENVQQVNIVVHTVNENGPDCSLCEQQCSLCETEGDALKENIIEGDAVKESGAALAATITLRTLSEQQKKALDGGEAPAVQPQPKRVKRTDTVPKPAAISKPKKPVSLSDPLATATPAARAIMEEWQAIFTDDHPHPATKIMAEHAETLVLFRPAPGEVAACRLWMYHNDKNGWYAKRGMHLGDVAREFERFRSLASVPAASTVPAGKTAQSISSFDNPDYDMSHEFYPSDAEKVQRRQQQYAQC